jgi:hypothetical protein
MGKKKKTKNRTKSIHELNICRKRLCFFLIVFYRYFDQYDYFDHSKILIFIFSSRRRHRRRHQYEIIQKIFC